MHGPMNIKPVHVTTTATIFASTSYLLVRSTKYIKLCSTTYKILICISSSIFTWSYFSMTTVYDSRYTKGLYMVELTVFNCLGSKEKKYTRKSLFAFKNQMGQARHINIKVQQNQVMFHILSWYLISIFKTQYKLTCPDYFQPLW
jgi:hypothetical protein